MHSSGDNVSLVRTKAYVEVKIRSVISLVGHAIA